MILIFFGDEGHRARASALAAATPGSMVTSVNTPPMGKNSMNITTLTFWGHGDASKVCGLTASAFVSKVKEWMKHNPVKTVEIITCNSRHGTIDSKLNEKGEKEVSWIKSYTDQVKPGLKKLGLTVKALPMGIGWSGENRWSILKFSPTTNTWMYVTAGGEKDTDAMWPGVTKVEQDDTFKATKDFTLAGQVVKDREKLRNFTLDVGDIGALRNSLIVLA
jgi:hypothetical protein